MDDFVKKVDCQYNKERCYETNIKPIMEEIKEIKDKLELVLVQTAKYGERLKPLEKIVYGMVGTILSIVLGSLIYLVVKIK